MYDDPFAFNPPRLTRASVRKAIKKRALFEFEQVVALQISRKDPEALLDRFLARFDSARSIDRLLALGREHREPILEVLLAILGFFDDPAVKETLPPGDPYWFVPPNRQRGDEAPDETFARLASALETTAEIYDEVDPDRSAEDRRVASVFRTEAATVVMWKKTLFDKHVNPPKRAGAPARTETRFVVVIGRLAELPHRWELASDLVRDFFDVETSAENLRLRIADRARFHPPNRK